MSQYATPLDFKDLDVSTIDVPQLEEQLNRNPKWTALPTALKTATIGALQVRVARALVKECLKKEDVSEAPTEGPVEASRLQVKPARKRAPRKKSEDKAEQQDKEEQPANE
jgi:hypothetical protein